MQRTLVHLSILTNDSSPAAKKQRLNEPSVAPKRKKTPKRRGIIPGYCQYETKKDIGDAVKVTSHSIRLTAWQSTNDLQLAQGNVGKMNNKS